MKSVLKNHIRAAGLAAAALAMFAASPALSQELNALIWCDHADPALLQPFEEANGVKVNVKEFEGTGAGLALVEQSQPGDWDVMVIDSIDVPRGVEKGLFEPLPEDQLPFADLFPEVKMDASTVVDGKRYGITEKFGYNTIAYNKDEGRPCRHAVAGVADRSQIQGPDRHLRLLFACHRYGGAVDRQEDRRTDRGRPAGHQGRALEDEGKRQAGRRDRREPDRAGHWRGRHSGRRRRIRNGGSCQGEPGARLLDP